MIACVRRSGLATAKARLLAARTCSCCGWSGSGCGLCSVHFQCISWLLVWQACCALYAAMMQWSMAARTSASSMSMFRLPAGWCGYQRHVKMGRLAGRQMSTHMRATSHSRKHAQHSHAEGFWETTQSNSMAHLTQNAKNALNGTPQDELPPNMPVGLSSRRIASKQACTDSALCRCWRVHLPEIHSQLKKVLPPCLSSCPRADLGVGSHGPWVHWCLAVQRS